MRNVKFLLSLLFLSLVLYNCQKSETENEQWLTDFLDNSFIFKENSNLLKPDLLESRTQNEMEQKVKTYFTQNPKYAKMLEAKFGYPVWDFAKYFGGPEKVYAIPFSKKSDKSTEMYLFAITNPISTEPTFKVVDRKYLKNFTKGSHLKKNGDKFSELSIEFSTLGFMYFDLKLFDVEDCSLNENFDQFKSSSELEERLCGYELVTTTKCEWGVKSTYWDQYGYGNLNYGYTCTTNTDWKLVCSTDDTGSIGGTTSGTSTGGTGTNNGCTSCDSWSSNDVLGGQEMNGLKLDPDLWPDCESFEFQVADNGIYQTCAVIGMTIDASRQFINSKGDIRIWHIGWEFPTLYFEFPHIRQDGSYVSQGKAATICAKLVRQAELNMEKEFQYNENAPSGYSISSSFSKHLKELLRLQGGRVSNVPNYGYSPINPMSYKKLSYGNCL